MLASSLFACAGNGVIHCNYILGVFKYICVLGIMLCLMILTL